MQEIKALKSVADLSLNENCCGCMACYNICPVEAIVISQNDRGFYVPEVQKNCIGCSKCISVCQIATQSKNRKKTTKVLASVHSEEQVRLTSSSGGIFSAICQSLYREFSSIRVFASKWDEKLNVVYDEAVEYCQCESFRGSKYVQSNLGNTLKKIGTYLKEKKYVLFCGTGCQCNGLVNYLETQKISDETLFLIDFVCHGVPSSRLWQDYLASLKQNHGVNITSYSFRNKAEGWGMYPIAIDNEGKIIPKNALFMSYARLFGNISLNNICYNCNFACKERVGDITLGDFWGIEKTDCSFNDGQGVSLVLINSKKGKSLWDLTASHVISQEIQDEVYLQPQLMAPTKKNVLAEQFWIDYQRYGYVYVSKKYAEKNKIQRAIQKFAFLIKDFFK